jgi:hypothetical protein
VRGCDTRLRTSSGTLSSQCGRRSAPDGRMVGAPVPCADGSDVLRCPPALYARRCGCALARRSSASG